MPMIISFAQISTRSKILSDALFHLEWYENMHVLLNLNWLFAIESCKNLSTNPMTSYTFSIGRIIGSRGSRPWSPELYKP